MSTIYYHMKEPAVTVLGPGTRYVLWVQGCHKNCPGCIAPDSHDMSKGRTITAGALAWEIALSGAEGLTISGGEPFLQAEALAQMVRQLQGIRPMGVIVYTGYQYEQLQRREDARKLLELTDLLIDGEYIRERNDNKGLRGSDNQRLIPLTDRYRDLAQRGGEGPRQQQSFDHGYEIHQVGLPDVSGAYK